MRFESENIVEPLNVLIATFKQLFVYKFLSAISQFNDRWAKFSDSLFSASFTTITNVTSGFRTGCL